MPAVVRKMSSLWISASWILSLLASAAARWHLKFSVRKFIKIPFITSDIGNQIVQMQSTFRPTPSVVEINV